MGTTPNGLRYPDGTLLASDLDLAVQQLALDVDDQLPRRVLAKMSATSSQSIPSNAYTQVIMGQIDVDTAGICDLPNSQMTVPVSGWYRVGCSIFYAGSTNLGSRYAAARTPPLSSGAFAAFQALGGNGSASTSIMPQGNDVKYLTAGTVLQLAAYQNSGAPISTTNPPEFNSFSLTWLTA